jgi:hypothetical protein
MSNNRATKWATGWAITGQQPVNKVSNWMGNNQASKWATEQAIERAINGQLSPQLDGQQPSN